MFAIGIDVGGTKTAAGVVDLATGQVAFRLLRPTAPERGGEAVLQSTLELAQECLGWARANGREARSVGIGVAELVDLEGNVTSEHTIRWRGLPVREVLSRLAPAAVDSDVRAAARAESEFGAGSGLGSFVYVSVGTGISYTAVIEGRPWPGARGNAILLGSGKITVPCFQCGATSSFVLEDWASGPALARRYSAESGRTVNRAQEVFAAAADGDEFALAVLRSAGEALGNAIGYLVNIVDPQAAVIGGGLGLSSGPYWDALAASTRDHVWADGSRGIDLIPASLGADAGVVGAALARPY